MSDIALRPVSEQDLELLFDIQLDAEANWMAAFTARDPYDREAFWKHWHRVLADPQIVARAVTVEDRVVGSIVSFVMGGAREVGYWIARGAWGQGVATEALRQFLDVVGERPLSAHVAADNRASRRVLEKCGFRQTGTGRCYAEARDDVIEEIILTLEASAEAEPPAD